MSTRTILEVNHDRVWMLYRDGHISEALYNALVSTEPPRERRFARFPDGVRKLAERHHSDRLSVAVGNTIAHEE